MPGFRPVLRAALLACAAAVCAPASAGEDILAVLDRSQTLRLQALTPVADDDPRAATVRASFERLLQGAEGLAGRGVALQVVRGAITAETFHGRLVVVNADLADLPEGERLFVLAHELGHVAQAHWVQVGDVYRKHIPDEVLQSRTDAVAALLGREMSALSHQHELAADAYALRMLQRLGYGLDVALATFTRHGLQFDTATHPGTRKRVASLRAVAP